jgi:tripartite-type tricarboxylate transporter receptor subunit TctC
MTDQSKRVRSRWLWTALLAALALGLAACGGSESDEGAATDGTEEVDTDPTAETESTEDAESTEGDVADFYEGTTVTLIVTQPPGGGFDTYARLYAKYMPQYLPGEPTIVVENMPGAGNLVGMNYLAQAAENDGSVFGTGEGAVALQQLFGVEGVQFDMSTMRYIGMPDEPVNMVLTARADAGVTDFSQLLEDGGPELSIGIPAPGSLLADPAILLESIVGANIQLVPGYEGTGPLALAVEQGEVDAFFASEATFEAEYQDKISSGEWIPLLQTAEPGAPNYLEDVPDILSLAEDDEQRQLLAVGSTYRAYVRPYFTPPGVPDDRFEALKAAWEATNENPDFLAEAEEAGRPVAPVAGEEIERIYQSYMETPEGVVQQLQEALELGL